MPDLADVWAWTSALKSSVAFAIVLPIALAMILAMIVDRVEAHLNELRSQPLPIDIEPEAASRVRSILIGGATRGDLR